MQLMVAILDFFPLIYEAVLLQVHCKMSKIEINNIYKIFGNKPQSVMQMVKDGATKEEVLEKTGHTVGLDNVCLLYTSPSPRDVSSSRMPSSA